MRNVTATGIVMKMYSTLCDSKCGSFNSNLDIVKIEASKLAKKYNHAVHIVEIIGQAVPIVTIEVNMEEQ